MTNSDIWMISLTALIAVAGVISATIFNTQLSVMQGQLEEMKATSKQTDELVEATKRAAEAAKASSDSIASIERPYIFISAKPTRLVERSTVSNIAPDISYSLVNMGRVPAVIRLLYVQCFVTQELNTTPSFSLKKFKLAQSVISAGSTVNNLPNCALDAPLSENDWADIGNGNKSIIFISIILYDGALDYTYSSMTTYKIDPFTGDIFAIGGNIYNREDSARGRISNGAPNPLPNLVP